MSTTIIVTTSPDENRDVAQRLFTLGYRVNDSWTEPDAILHNRVWTIRDRQVCIYAREPAPLIIQVRYYRNAYEWREHPRVPARQWLAENVPIRE